VVDEDFFFGAPLISSNFLGELFLKPSAFFNLVRFFGSGKSFNLAMVKILYSGSTYILDSKFVDPSTMGQGRGTLDALRLASKLPVTPEKDIDP